MLINFFFADITTKKILYSYNNTNLVFDNALVHYLPVDNEQINYLNKYAIENKIYCILCDTKYIYVSCTDSKYSFDKIYNSKNKNSLFGELQQYTITFNIQNFHQNDIFFTNLYEKYKNPAEKIQNVLIQIDEIKEQSIQNINKIIDRGEKIELLVDKSEALLNSSYKFEHQAIVLKKRMCCESYKLRILIFIIIITVMASIILITYFTYKNK